MLNWFKIILNIVKLTSISQVMEWQSKAIEPLPRFVALFGLMYIFFMFNEISFFLDQKIKWRNGEKVQIFDVVELCLHVKME